MAATHVEREDKYDVDEGFRLPAGLADIEPRIVALETTYFDTDDHDLLRQRITLRRRTGDADTGWQLKVPHGAARLEVQLPLVAGEAVPDRLHQLVTGVTLGEPLAPVAVLRTERTLRRVRDGERVLAEIADDRVHAAATGTAARVSQWREIEVELVEGDEQTLRRLGRQLRKAGAVPARGASKLARALDWPAADPDASTDALGLLRYYLAVQYAALAAGDVSLRRGQDAVHRTRVAARRFRSVLRVFRPVLDAPLARALETELSWYQDLLGEVRDAQVQRARFVALLDGLPPELVLGPVAADLEADLRGVQARALELVREAVHSPRYLAMMARARDWAGQPALDAGTTVGDLREFAAIAHRTATKRRKAALRSGASAELHRARKAGKRARYAAEAVRPVAGRRNTKLIKAWKRRQDVLGRYQDSVVASEHLRRLGAASAAEGRNGFTAGLLFAREQECRRDLLALAKEEGKV